MIPKGHLSLLITFDDCFWLSFLLSMMIVFEIYVDCFLRLFLIEFWLSLMIVLDWVLIVFDDYFWLSSDPLDSSMCTLRTLEKLFFSSFLELVSLNLRAVESFLGRWSWYWRWTSWSIRVGKDSRNFIQIGKFIW